MCYDLTYIAGRENEQKERKKEKKQMGRSILENDKIKLEMDSLGAEMKSLFGKNSGREYMWHGDPAYWGRTAPVLFPFVGSLKDKKYRVNGREYGMGQHGFARDMEFTLLEQNKDNIRFVLESDEETRKKYPFDFSLELGYALNESSVRVFWKVINKGKEEMPFSIGGHPAFLCPVLPETVQTDYYISFDADQPLISDVIEDGLIGDALKEYSLENGYLKITDDLFDGDALIMEKDQAHSVSLCLPDKTPYLTVKFGAPLFGIWSPVKKNAPFICIEPWYGRADRVRFDQELRDREWSNLLKNEEIFEASYDIVIYE